MPAFTEPEVVLTPERRLLIARLDVTLAPLANRDSRVRDDARRWFLDDRSLLGSLSLWLVCDPLNIRPDDG